MSKVNCKLDSDEFQVPVTFNAALSCLIAAV